MDKLKALLGRLLKPSPWDGLLLLPVIIAFVMKGEVLMAVCSALVGAAATSVGFGEQMLSRREAIADRYNALLTERETRLKERERLLAASGRTLHVN